jgi:hypothetical protein
MILAILILDPGLAGFCDTTGGAIGSAGCPVAQVAHQFGHIEPRVHRALIVFMIPVAKILL